jgi:hypothetical protein
VNWAVTERAYFVLRGWAMSEWHMSSRCSSGGTVEVKVTEKVVLVRDSTDPRGGELAFSTSMWRAFLATIKSGDLNGR